MQVAEAYAIKKKAKSSEATKPFRMKRATLAQAEQAPSRDNSRGKIARGDRVENNLKEWMNATRKHENIAEYNSVVCTNHNQ